MARDRFFVGEYEIPIDIKFRESNAELEELATRYEDLIRKAETVSLSEQRKVVRAFAEEYLTLRSRLDKVSYPVRPILEEMTHRDAMHLFGAIAGF